MEQNAAHSVSPDIDLRRWLWIASVWLAVGLFEATQTVVTMRAAGMHHAWTRLFFCLLLGWVPLILFTPMVLRLGHLSAPSKWKQISFWLIHLPACIGICAAATAWSAGLERSLNPWSPDSAPGQFLPLWLMKFENSLLAYLILYASILAISSSLDSRERLARKETETAQLNEQLSKARLHALRQQIEPHFLFNTLNSVSGLVREGRNGDAVKMIAGLSDFLRRVVRDSARQEVTLGEEMDFIDKYLEIQKVRFAERLQLYVNVPADLYSARVPSLLLQPVVENALKHGIANRAHPGTVRIEAHRLNGDLRIIIYNDGPSLAEDWKASSGIGISNLQDRLRSLYGDNSRFRLENRHLGVEALILLPYLSEANEEDHELG